MSALRELIAVFKIQYDNSGQKKAEAGIQSLIAQTRDLKASLRKVYEYSNLANTGLQQLSTNKEGVGAVAGASRQTMRHMKGLNARLKKITEETKKTVKHTQGLKTEYKKVSSAAGTAQIATKRLNKATKETKQKVKDTATAAERLEKGLSAAAAALVVIGAYKLTRLAGEMIKLASDAREVQALLEDTFGHARARSIEQWSNSYAKVVHRSRFSLQAYSASLGATMKGLLENDEATFKYSKRLSELAINLGSAYNKEPIRVIEAMKSAMTGMVKPMRSFGVNVQKLALEEYALSQGIKGGLRSMSLREQALLRIRLILDKTKPYWDNAITTQDDWANALRSTREQVRQLGTGAGQFLKEVLRPLLTRLRDVLETFNVWADESEIFTGIAVALTTAIGFLGRALLLKLVPGLTLTTAAMKLLQGTVILGIFVALAAAIDDVFVFLKGGNSVLGDFLKLLLGGEEQVNSFRKAWYDLATGIGDGIVESIDFAIDKIKSLLRVLTAVTEYSISSFGKKIRKIANVPSEVGNWGNYFYDKAANAISSHFQTPAAIPAGGAFLSSSPGPYRLAQDYVTTGSTVNNSQATNHISVNVEGTNASAEEIGNQVKHAVEEVTGQ